MLAVQPTAQFPLLCNLLRLLLAFSFLAVPHSNGYVVLEHVTPGGMVE
jgi:hypothetical protein